jgi:hypothetical protein
MGAQTPELRLRRDQKEIMECDYVSLYVRQHFVHYSVTMTHYAYIVW